jgi:hypothetical protein
MKDTLVCGQVQSCYAKFCGINTVLDGREMLAGTFPARFMLTPIVPAAPWELGAELR